MKEGAYANGVCLAWILTNYLEFSGRTRKGLVPNRSEWNINLPQEKSQKSAQATHFLLTVRFPLSIHYFDLGFVSLEKCMMFSISSHIPCKQNHLMIKLKALKGSFHILYCKK